MMLKKTILTVMMILLLTPLSLKAQEKKLSKTERFFEDHEISIGYAPWCEHVLADNPKYNERNNHLFMISLDQWFIMTFRNSYYDRTYAIGYTFRTKKWEPFENDFFVRGNLSIAAVYGYEDRNVELWGISPGGVATLELGYENFSMHFAAVPVASVMFTWTF